MDYRAFFLRPDIPPEGVPRSSSSHSSSDRLQTYAKEAGLVFNRPPITSYTRYALEATEYAKQVGLAHEFHWAAYKSYWGDGRDLGKLEVLREVAESVGMEWEPLRHHLQARTFKEEVERQHADAIRIGVTGIPAYVIGRFFFMGAQPYELFKQVAERALARLEAGEETADG